MVGTVVSSAGGFASGRPLTTQAHILPGVSGDAAAAVRAAVSRHMTVWSIIVGRQWAGDRSKVFEHDAFCL